MGGAVWARRSHTLSAFTERVWLRPVEFVKMAEADTPSNSSPPECDLHEIPVSARELVARETQSQSSPLRRPAAIAPAAVALGMSIGLAAAYYKVRTSSLFCGKFH